MSHKKNHHGLLLISMFIVLTNLSACSVSPTHHALKDKPLPDLIPVRTLVANVNDKGSYRISPDGKKIAWKGVDGVNTAIFVRDLQTNETIIFHRPAKSRGLNWAGNSNSLFIYQDDEGKENTHIYKIDLQDEQHTLQNITPYPGVKVQIHRIPLDDHQHMVISHNRINKSQFDLYRLNYQTG